jgi:hypothetical protein
VLRSQSFVTASNGPLRVSLARQSFPFLFKVIQRGYPSFSEGAQRDHESDELLISAKGLH